MIRSRCWGKVFVSVKTPFIVVFLILASISFIIVTSNEAQAGGPGTLYVQVFPGDSVVDLTWGPSWFSNNYNGSYNEGYHIYRGLSPDNLTLYATNDVTGFTDTSVVNGLVYYYKIAAFDNTGEGPATLVSAMPRLGPSNVQYSPHEVSDCDTFHLSISWSMPIENSTNVTAFRIYPEYGSPYLLDINSTSTTIDVGSWGPHVVRISAVFADGRESFAPAIIVDGPMCEDGGLCSYLLIGLIALVVLISIMIIVFLLLRKRRRSSN
jgi:hypothetical protein